MPSIFNHLGEAAALGAATCWVFTSLAFAAAGRRIGPTAVNLLRILLAWVLLVGIHRLATGVLLPPVDSTALAFLAVSGVIGFAIGDQCFFAALVDVGPRLSTLLMTLTPPTAALLAWVALKEPLSLSAIIGIAVTLAGIGWVAIERPDPTAHRPHPHRIRGLICGSLAAICQATGLILSKIGMGHGRALEVEHLNPWSASIVRVTFGAIAICILAMVRRAGRSATAAGSTVQFGFDPEHLKHFPHASPDRKSVIPMALLMLSIGAILGPVVGVWFSLVAIDRAPAGIAATLMAMTPVFILPLAAWIERERLSWRAVLGAIVAVAGVGICFDVHHRILGALHLSF